MRYTLTNRLNNRYTVFSAYLVRNLTQLCPRSFRLPALIMLSSKTKPIIQICIVENDVAMQVRLIMNIAEENQQLRKRIKALEKENRHLSEMNEFLEDAAAFFAASRQKFGKNND